MPNFFIRGRNVARFVHPSACGFAVPVGAPKIRAVSRIDKPSTKRASSPVEPQEGQAPEQENV
jgi:hypothetical protein